MFRSSAIRVSITVAQVFLLVLPAEAGDILRGGAASSNPRRAATAGANAGADSAAQLQTNARDRLSRTTQALNSVKDLQAAARAAAQRSNARLPNPNNSRQRLPAVPDGLRRGGLQVADGVPKNLDKPKKNENANLWVGAELPRESGKGGEKTVTIVQTEQNALLNWKTFNIGKKTTLEFDQRAGGSDRTKWIAFNKVNDPSGRPSQILGSIKADGQVYVINRNGIIFGGSSQVNVHTLVASGLDINDNLIERGLLDNPDAEFLFAATKTQLLDRTVATHQISEEVDSKGVTTVSYLLTNGQRAELTEGTDYSTSRDAKTGLTTVTFTTAGLSKAQAGRDGSLQVDYLGRSGNVVVQKGARLVAPTSAAKVGGRIMLVGANVENAGEIATPDGQTILAAGLQVGIAEHDTDDPSLRGLDISIGAVDDPDVVRVSTSGTAKNTGLIEASRGNVTIAGKNVRQLGAIESSTSVSLNGRVDLLASYNSVSNPAYDPLVPATGTPFIPKSTGEVKLGEDSLIRILPEVSSDEKIAGTELSLASRVNIVGGNVHLATGSTILAPGATVDIAAGRWLYQPSTSLTGNNPPRTQFIYTAGQIYLDRNAMIDVAGTTNVQLELSRNLLEVELRGNELADSPLQRDGVLRSIDGRTVTLTVDIREYGTYEGRDWVGTPLGDITGFVDLIERGAAELSVAGGNVNLRAGNSVVLQKSSLIDVSGGWKSYGSGFVNTTRVVSQGRLIDIADATPDLVYDGVYNPRTTVTRDKWGISETYRQPLELTQRRYDPGYVEGADAGAITITAPSMALDGRLAGNVTTGTRQLRDANKRTQLPTAGSLKLTFEATDATPYAFAQFPTNSPTPPRIVFSSKPQTTVADYGVDAVGNALSLDAERVRQVNLNPDIVNEWGFSSLAVTNSAGRITVPGDVSLETAPNGSIEFKASRVDIAGSIRSPGGSLKFTVYAFSPYEAEILLTDNTSPDFRTPAARRGWGDFILRPGAALDVSGLVVDDRSFASDPSGQPIVLGGGSIEIDSYNARLAAGATLDVSGGARVDPGGRISYGDAGSLTIRAGQDPRIDSLLGGRMVLRSTLRGYSGADGGSLTVQAPLIRLGRQGSAPGRTYFSSEFLNEGGFSSFTFIGLGDRVPRANPFESGEPITAEEALRTIGDDSFRPGLVIEADATLAPVVQSLRVIPVTGDETLRIETTLLPKSERPAVSLSFESPRVSDTFLRVLTVRGDLIQREGSTIDAGPRGSVSFSGDAVSLLGRVRAAGGSIAVKGADSFPLYAGQSTGAQTTVYLGPKADLSVAGTVVYEANDFGFRQGEVLAGGSISLEGNILAMPGSRLDVSGASAVLDLTPAETDVNYHTRDQAVPVTSGLTTERESLVRVPTVVDSDAGSITLKGSEQLFVASTLRGQAGGPTAAGGSLSVESGLFNNSADFIQTPLDVTLVVTQDRTGIPVGYEPGRSTGIGAVVRRNDGAAVPGRGYFAADLFQESGLDSLELHGTVRFRDRVAITARRELSVADGGVIYADRRVTLSAPYVKLGTDFTEPLGLQDSRRTAAFLANGQSFYFRPRHGRGSLIVRADLIDIGNLSLQNIGRASFFAVGGDIRGNGTFNIAGRLQLQAGQIYPTSGSTFTIAAFDYRGVNDKPTDERRPGEIVVLDGGHRRLPLSAGGDLQIYASEISVGGTLRAPLGSITVGWDGSGSTPVNPITGSGVATTPAAAIRATERLVLNPGAELSVTAVDTTGEELLIPYGVLVNGTAWVDPRGVDITTSGVPAKTIRLGGRNVAVRSGSTLDVRGGGDLYAYRWVEGAGGSQDVLASEGSFAVIPNYEADYAPYAPFNSGSEASALDGDPGYVNSGLRVGDKVYLSGSSDLPAGTYTLLPARYALLPGAVLVTPTSNSPQGTRTNPDGSRLVSGYRTNSLNPDREAPRAYTQFEVASASVVRARSTYEDYTANQFLSESPTALELDVPRLPVDAGRVVFQAVESMRLRGSLRSERPEGGIGAYVDISSPVDILITDRASSRRGPKDTLVLNSAEISAFGAESLLVGGLRETTEDGAKVQVLTGSITVDNARSPLSGSEIILVANQGLTLAAGAKVLQTGLMVAEAETLLLEGDGTLLRVSSDPLARIERSGVTTAQTARLIVGRNATIAGRSLILDSSYGTELNSRANLEGRFVSLNSGQITIQFPGVKSVAATDGLVLAGETLRALQGLEFLSLLSYSSLDVYGSGRLAVDGTLELHAAQIRGFDAGRATFSAADLLIDNRAGGRRLSAGPADAGQLTFEGDQVRLGLRRVVIDQFARVRVNADRQLRLEKAGGLITRGDLVINSAYVDAAPSATYEIRAAGALDLIAPRGARTLEVSPGLGASLSLQGSRVRMNTNVFLPSGQVNVTATGGDVRIGGRIDVSGSAVFFNDAVRYTNAGNIVLSAQQGDVRLDRSGSLVLEAPNAAGNAGLLSIKAPNGTLSLQGSLDASVGRDGVGGRFELDIGRLEETSRLGGILARAGFSGEQNLRVRQGDVLVNGVTRTRNFRLSADAGSIRVTGTIDASGTRGGEITLSASGSLVLEPTARLSVAAETFDAAGKGGSIWLGAGAAIDGVVDSSAVLDLRAGSVLDLRVAESNARSQSLGRFTGTLHLRAPRNAANTDLALTALDSTVRGASSIAVEGFRVYSLSGSGALTTALRSQVNNDGIAFLGAAGTDSANATAILARILANNASLESVLSLRPGVEIINLNGDLTLGSSSSNTSLDWNLQTFRYGAKSAPGVLTLRARGDVALFNAIQDGFDIQSQNTAYLAQLMAPNASLPLNAQSWSFRIAAGSDLSAADFRRVLPVDRLAADKGSLRLGKNFTGQISGGLNAVVNTALGTATNRFQVIRTGSGDIDISAGRDVRLLNPFASIYTAGTRVADPTEGGRFDLPILDNQGSQSFLGAIQQSNAVAQYSLGGGNVTIRAQLDIARYNTLNTGALSPDSSRQLPSNWLYRRGYVDRSTGNFGTAVFGDVASTTWWVDFANFFQSVGALGGGNVTLLAERDVKNVDAVAPTNARMLKGRPTEENLIELGGGDVLVRAGRDIDAGIYYVERGQGTLEAGRAITTNASRSPSRGLITNSAPLAEQTWLPTTLFVGKGSFTITAASDILLGPVSNPFLLPGGINNTYWYKTYFTTYSADASVDVLSLGGDVTVRTEVTTSNSTGSTSILQLWLRDVLSQRQTGSVALIQPWLRINETNVRSFDVTSTLFPPTFRATSISGNVNLVGDLTLAPASRGTIELLAGGSILGLQPTGISQTTANQSRVAWGSSRINVSDASPSSIPRITSPFAYQNLVGTSSAARSSDIANFLSFISLALTESGSPDATLQTKQNLHAPGPLHANDPEPVRLYALEGDISGLTLFSPKSAEIIAGNDITDIAFYIQNVSDDDVSLVFAGRDLVPYNANAPLRSLATSAGNILNFGETPLAGDIQISGPGAVNILAGRNLDLGTGENNSDGTGVGITTIGNLRNPYLPFAGASISIMVGFGDFSTGVDFEGFIEEYLGEASARTVTNAEGRAVPFSSLSSAQQRAVATEVFFDLLRQAGRDGNYESGYAAIATLFPGGDYFGSLNARARDIRTKNGGDIAIFAPGGGLSLANTLLGNTLAPPGVITETGGNINIFTHTDVDIGIGRIFTLRGGDITIWSSTGDIAAGSASRTVASAPPTRVTFDPQSADLSTDLAGLATGGGIGVLATVEGVPPGNVDLIAPVGTVDAGEAGIRSSGTVNVAAQRVLNAANISAAQGTTGVPSTAPPAAPPPAAPPGASNPTAATNAAANDIASQAQPQAAPEQTPSVITVEVLGYGGGDDSAAASTSPTDG